MKKVFVIIFILCLFVMLSIGYRIKISQEQVKALVNRYAIAAVNQDSSSLLELENELAQKQIKIHTNLIIKDCIQLSYVYKNRTTFVKGCYK